MATILAQPLACAEELDRVDSSPAMVNLVLTTLNGAQTVAICSFKIPEGLVIAKMLRGNPMKIGQLWNSTSFPKKPILAYERTSHHLGDGRTELMVTGFLELDHSKKFIVMDSLSPNERILVSLDDVEVALNKKNAEQDAPSNR